MDARGDTSIASTKFILILIDLDLDLDTIGMMEKKLIDTRCRNMCERSPSELAFGLTVFVGEQKLRFN